MRSTAAHPAPPPLLYRQLRDDAVLAESLGFHSLWLAEHHFWYDGWCPSPLVAAASALSATRTLRVGTGVHLLPLYEPDQIAAQLAWIQRLFDRRLEFGVGLGYRASEYDGYGLSRRSRGRRMEAALDRIADLGELGPPIWIGGFSEPALERTGRRGLGVLLPSTVTSDQMARAVALARSKAAETRRSVRIGVMKYAWVTDGSEAERAWAAARLAEWTREYAGAWFPLKGRLGFEVPELLDQQIQRSADTALIGSPGELVASLRELEDAGAELAVLHLIGDARLPQQRQMMTTIAEEVLPSLGTVAA